MVQLVEQSGDNMPKEHSSAFDGRMADYMEQEGFTPALFQAMSIRHKEHIDRLEKSHDALSKAIGDAVLNLSSDIKELTKQVSGLPCDKHEGERKLLESRVSRIENKPVEDRKLSYMAMVACGAVGGLIVSGVLNIQKIAMHVLGI